jgi:hypothetical protein
MFWISGNGKPVHGFNPGQNTNVKGTNTRPDERAQGNRSADFRPNRREM